MDFGAAPTDLAFPLDMGAQLEGLEGFARIGLRRLDGSSST